MPPVPRPLPKEYSYITEAALLMEAQMAAPYFELGLTTDFTEPLPIRKLRRLEKW